MHGVHHELEDGIEDLAGLFGVTVRKQLHRALHIGEEDGDLLALAFQRALGCEDFLGEVLGRVRLGGIEARRRWRGG
jgi:hypothetical protein